MQVFVFDDQPDLSISPSSVEPIVSSVLIGEGRAYDEVGIHFVTTKEICRLHALYFDDPSPTDCISFPLDLDIENDPTGCALLGDAFVCPATARDFVAEHGGDVYEETTLYLVHSLLHLLGYDDIDAEDEKRMRQAEARHMEQIKKKGLLLASS